MSKSSKQKSIIEVADQKYSDAIFGVLINVQSIEALLKECIIHTYEIIDHSCPNGISFNPAKQKKDIENRLGLYGLAAKFKEVTPHKHLCGRIKTLSRKRNKIAHTAAKDYLQHPTSKTGAEEILLKTEELYKIAEEANKIYYELADVYNNIMEIHGKII